MRPVWVTRCDLVEIKGNKKKSKFTKTSRKKKDTHQNIGTVSEAVSDGDLFSASNNRIAQPLSRIIRELGLKEIQGVQAAGSSPALLLPQASLCRLAGQPQFT